jgi:predicted dehydrogenase
MAAIKDGKHVFAEKGVAVDAPGVRLMIEASKLATEKKLSIV